MMVIIESIVSTMWWLWYRFIRTLLSVVFCIFSLYFSIYFFFLFCACMFIKSISETGIKRVRHSIPRCHQHQHTLPRRPVFWGKNWMIWMNSYQIKARKPIIIHPSLTYERMSLYTYIRTQTTENPLTTLYFISKLPV